MKNTCLILLIITISSCGTSIDIEETSKYEIISMLYSEIAKPLEPFFPPPRPDGRPFTSQDSIRIEKMIKESKEEINKRTFIVAVDTLFSNTGFGPINIKEECQDYSSLVSKLFILKKKEKLNLDKIKSNKNNSIIPFTENLLTTGTNEFIKFDYFISFSHITFNEDYNKSVVIVSGSRSKLAGGSAIYFLEKIKNKWSIACSILLEIS